ANRANVRAILGMKVGDEPRIEPRRSIPDERVKILAHRMEWIAGGRCLHRAANITEASVDVFALEPDARPRLMMISPIRVGRFLSPRRALADHNAGIELIISEHALPLRMMAEEQNQV